MWKQEEKSRSIITKLGTEMSKKRLFAMSLCNFGMNIFSKINSVHSLAKMLRDLGQENVR